MHLHTVYLPAAARDLWILAVPRQSPHVNVPPTLIYYFTVPTITILLCSAFTPSHPCNYFTVPAAPSPPTPQSATVMLHRATNSFPYFFFVPAVPSRPSTPAAGTIGTKTSSKQGSSSSSAEDQVMLTALGPDQVGQGGFLCCNVVTVSFLTSHSLSQHIGIGIHSRFNCWALTA